MWREQLLLEQKILASKLEDTPVMPEISPYVKVTGTKVILHDLIQSVRVEACGMRKLTAIAMMKESIPSELRICFGLSI